jgi:nitroreductase
MEEAMDYWLVVKKRYSVRSYDPDTEVSPQTVEKLLGAAVQAPSAGNRQPWHFYVVRDRATRQGLEAAAYGQEFVSQAPVVIVVCADAEQSAGRYGDRGRELYCIQDTAAAVEHILLAAVALELGSCWVGAFDELKASQVLDLPSHHRPVAILPIGKPAIDGSRRTRRQSFDQVVTYL